MALSLRTRRDVFVRYPGLAALCAGFQAGMRASEHPYEPGESVWLEGDEDAPTVLSVEQAAKLNREDAAMLDALCDSPADLAEGDTSLAQAHGHGVRELILEPGGTDFGELTKTVGASITRLAEAIGAPQLAVLPLLRTSILAQENDDREAVKARETLITLGFDPSSFDAVEGSPQDMTEAIGPLFWIARCNASAPIIALGIEGTNLAFSFCKYGNFHVDIPDPVERAALIKKAEQVGMVETEACRSRY